jgi:hypothetical protein
MVQEHLRRYVAQGCVQKLISDEGLAHGRLLTEADLHIELKVCIFCGGAVESIDGLYRVYDV